MEPSEEAKSIDTIEGHQRFIKSQWRDVASFAWERYQSEGRGAVIVDLTRASRKETGLHVPTFYVGDTSERLEKSGGWPSDEIAQAVKDYDPEQDVVFIFLRLDGEILHYQVSDLETPRQLFEEKEQQEE